VDLIFARSGWGRISEAGGDKRTACTELTSLEDSGGVTPIYSRGAHGVWIISISNRFRSERISDAIIRWSVTPCQRAPS
jgi:hypothetical protein